jgi:hypothetical protein
MNAMSERKMPSPQRRRWWQYIGPVLLSLLIVCTVLAAFVV